MNNLNFSQRGVSLLEILIALALSIIIIIIIIIILAMLRAFVTTGKVTAESSLGAKVDSSMMLGFIAADRILQGMGFGLTNTNAGYGTNFQVLDQDGTAVNLDSTSKKATGKFWSGNFQIHIAKHYKVTAMACIFMEKIPAIAVQV